MKIASERSHAMHSERATNGQSAIRKSSKLSNVCYDIRGPVLEEAMRLEAQGQRILKLNIGNPAPFGFEAPAEILQTVVEHLPQSSGYCDSKGLHSAREAVRKDCQQHRFPDVCVEDIYIGNGVSELIVMAMQAFLNDGDEVLVPAPDYPLWTAAITLAGGKAVHYRCDEAADWVPDLQDMQRKITARTRAIVVINPNNPTGAVYPRALLEELVSLACSRNLTLFSDEIYDRIIYDGAVHTPLATLTDELVVTFNGLSKTHRVAGFRTGWMVLSGTKERARDYIEGLNILASMRLCANVPSQHAIEQALGGDQSIGRYLVPGGRLYEQRQIAYRMLNEIQGVTCVNPKGALYLFPKLDVRRFNISDDERFAFDLLRAEKLLIVQGTGFNWPEPDHFRIVFLPNGDDLNDALNRLAGFLETYRQ